ncbi:hypothetical protein [Paenibacillus thalictri]|uniref:Copper amine oxidase-like N-terminal domain-containing protein n=1 Tax=Paenibacillus thalictri TaxID=2527873 RepID=A0A4Q9DY70_9BACL|nr:hypothetical protein [Paenibacillus thalictri]TBL81345.1 hypothetical protein EYB31_04480 [Paenibacillus thalictri]
MKTTRNKINPVALWLLALAFLCGLGSCFLALSFMHREHTKPDSETAEPASQLVKQESYRVLEYQKTHYKQLPQYEFPELNIAKGKGKVLQLTAKGAHVVRSIATFDNAGMMYAVSRTHQQDSDEWTELDAVTVNPQTGAIGTQALAVVNGPYREAAEKATVFAGFMNNDELLYASVRNAGEDLQHYIGKIQLSDGLVTPLIDLGSTKKGDTPSVALTDVWVSPDKKRVYVRDNQHAIVSYNLTTGAKTALVQPDSKDDGAFWLSEQDGLAYNSPDRFGTDGSLIMLGSGEVKKPYAAEKGFVEPGLVAKGSMLYYNFTTDREPQQVVKGDKRTLLLPQGLQLLDLSGNPLRRFTLPADAKEKIEYGGYSAEQMALILHKYTVAVNKKGQTIKKTAGWVLGDIQTGKLTDLTRIDVPDSWDRKDIVYAECTVNGSGENGYEQAFVNMLDNTYYPTKWNTQEMKSWPEQDAVFFSETENNRVFVSSFTRPDLVVSALGYQKYKWDNAYYQLLDGGWMARIRTLPDGDKMFFFPMN